MEEKTEQLKLEGVMVKFDQASRGRIYEAKDYTPHIEKAVSTIPQESPRLILYPNPLLKIISLKIEHGSSVEDFVKEMKKVLEESKNGIGIAAVQVGYLVRLFLGPQNQVFINPIILEAKGSFQKEVEGCLSIPNVFGKVKRYQKIKLRWYDENWVERTKVFKNYEARIIQHEMDHLEGVLFTERVKPEDRETGFTKNLKTLENPVS